MNTAIFKEGYHQTLNTIVNIVILIESCKQLRKTYELNRKSLQNTVNNCDTCDFNRNSLPNIVNNCGNCDFNGKSLPTTVNNYENCYFNKKVLTKHFK